MSELHITGLSSENGKVGGRRPWGGEEAYTWSGEKK